MKFASLLNVASNSSDGLAEFMFTPTAFENLAQKAPLLAMLLKNLSGDCKTKTHYTKPVIALNAPFGGRVTLAAPFNYSGRYSGTVTTKDGLAHVEVVLAATTDAPGARRVRAVVAQSGDLQNYSDSGSPLD